MPTGVSSDCTNLCYSCYSPCSGFLRRMFQVAVIPGAAKGRPGHANISLVCQRGVFVVFSLWKTGLCIHLRQGAYFGVDISIAVVIVLHVWMLQKAFFLKSMLLNHRLFSTANSPNPEKQPREGLGYLSGGF